jgi:hypothetical protein
MSLTYIGSKCDRVGNRLRPSAGQPVQPERATLTYHRAICPGFDMDYGNEGKRETDQSSVPRRQRSGGVRSHGRIRAPDIEDEVSTGFPEVVRFILRL